MAETETPVWGDELKDYIDIGTPDSPHWIEGTNLLSWEFDGDQVTYEPEYINRRTSPKFVLGETASISYEKDLYRNNALDAFLVEHEDDADIPVRVCRVRTWEGEPTAHGAKMAAFGLTPSQLDKNTAGEPVKLKGTLSMSDEGWTKGTFDTKGLAFIAEGETPVPPEEPSGPGTEDVQKSIDDMNLDELRAYAAAHSIDLEGKTLKADVLAAVKAAEAE